MRKLSYFLFALLFPATLIAQKPEQMSFSAFAEEYNALLAKQPTANYQVSITNLRFLNATDSEPTEQTRSNLTVTKETCFSFESKQGLLIQNEHVRLSVDTANKVLYLVKPIALTKPTDVTGIHALDSAGFVVEKTTSAAKVKYVLEQKQQSTSFRTMSIEFDAKTKQVVKIEILFWPGDYITDETNASALESPKMVYLYEDFKTLTTTKTSGHLTIDYWINTNNEPTAASKSAGYIVKDLRLNR